MGYNPEKKTLILEYIKMSKERIESAQALIEIKNFSDSISRSYYAFLDSATAALISNNIAPQSHAGAIALFGKHFIKTKFIPEKFGRWFNKIEKARLEADYKHLKKFTEKEAKEVLKEAKEFIAVVEKFLKEKEA